MSILATDKKLISFGTDYSAGSGISIIDHTISVTGEFGKTYNAGPNIDIYDVSGQPTISSKDWSNEISDASANSYTQSTSYFNNWVNGQYTGDITNITNNLTSLSGDLSSYYKKTETSSKEQISDAIQYVSAHAVGDVEVNNYVHNNSATIDEVNSAYKANSASYITAHQSLEGYATEDWVESKGYLTGVNIPESATWNDTSNVVKESSASWSKGTTYEGISPIVVNNNESKISADTWTLSAGDGISFTDDSANKVTRIDVTAQGGNYIPYTATNSAFKTFETNSGLDITTSDVGGGLKGNFITDSLIQLSYVYTPLSSNNISVWTTGHLTFKTNSDSAFVDREKIHTWDSASNYIQTISSTYYPKSNPSSFATESWVNGQGFLTAHQDISNKLDSSAFSTVSSDFLTTSFSIPESATWNETSNIVQTNSAQWGQGGGGGSVSSKYGTISVDGSDIEATNSAIEFNSNGFTSSFDAKYVSHENPPAIFTWDDYSQETSIHVEAYNNASEDTTLTYSSNTDVTGEIITGAYNSYFFDVQIPNATAIQFSADNGTTLQTTRVSAPSSYKVSELAWKSDLPTYEYDSNHKVSAINGSSLVGNEDYLVEQGFAQNLSSPKGTISVLSNNKIEGTNSAIASDAIEGFVSAYNDKSVFPGYSATLTWDRYVPNTMLFVSGAEYQEHTLTYSANTDVTGTIIVQANGQASIELPTDSTSIVIGNENWDVTNYNFTVSADNYYEIGELAWASAIPTYEYDSTNKISAINGSAVAQPTLSSLNTSNVNNIIVTASLPSTPDANTLYLIPEA